MLGKWYFYRMGNRIRLIFVRREFKSHVLGDTFFLSEPEEFSSSLTWPREKYEKNVYSAKEGIVREATEQEVSEIRVKYIMENL